MCTRHFSSLTNTNYDRVFNSPEDEHLSYAGYPKPQDTHKASRGITQLIIVFYCTVERGGQESLHMIVGEPSTELT